MSGFSTAPPPRWVGVVGQRAPVSGQKRVTHLVVWGDRVSITRHFPSLREQLPWFHRGDDGKVYDLRREVASYGVPVHGR